MNYAKHVGYLSRPDVTRGRLPDDWSTRQPATGSAARPDAQDRVEGRTLADRVLVLLTRAADMGSVAPYRGELAAMLNAEHAAINHAFQALAKRHPMALMSRGNGPGDYAITLPGGRIVRTAGMPKTIIP